MRVKAMSAAGHVTDRKKQKSRRGSERGDVLMEYVLLTILIVLPLIGVSSKLVQVPGPTVTVDGALEGDHFGLFGDAFVRLYRMVMSGVCLPLP